MACNTLATLRERPPAHRSLVTLSALVTTLAAVAAGCDGWGVPTERDCQLVEAGQDRASVEESWGEAERCDGNVCRYRSAGRERCCYCYCHVSYPSDTAVGASYWCHFCGGDIEETDDCW